MLSVTEIETFTPPRRVGVHRKTRRQVDDIPAHSAVRTKRMKSISQLDLHSLRVLDGGMASELERRGCDISGPLWSAHVLDSSPDAVKQVHLDYLRAGADCISTVSYQISNLGYAELGRRAED